MYEEELKLIDRLVKKRNDEAVKEARKEIANTYAMTVDLKGMIRDIASDMGYALNGKDGADGIDGLDGIDGKDGKDGKDGLPGKDGRPGRDGKDGKNGKDGADGLGIAFLKIENGELHITYTDGKTRNLGRVKGKDGKDGKEGKEGKAIIQGGGGYPGLDGKSAYQYAVEGGYAGTEAQFYIDLSNAGTGGGVELGETSTTAYRGDRGKTAYDHSQTAHAPSDAQKNSDITKAEIEAKLTGVITSHSHAGGASANTYYVSTTGDDGDPGTEAEPWLTITKALGEVYPGDTVIIRGGTYNERVYMQWSGTKGSPITFKAYPGELPIIDGTGIDWGYDWNGLLNLNHCKYINLIGLRVINARWAAIFAAHDDDGCADVLIQDCQTYHSQASGIVFNLAENITIDNCSIEDACYTETGSQEGISIAATTNVIVSNCHVFNFTNDEPGGGGEGIDLKDGCQKGKVFGNRVHDIAKIGIYIDSYDAVQNDIEVYNNTVYDCDSGITLASENSGTLNDISIHDNYVNNCVWGATIGGWNDGYTHEMNNITFSHNTVTNCEKGMYIGNDEVTNAKIYRNIFVGDGTDTPIYLVSGKSLTNYTIDFNTITRVVADHPTGTNYTVGTNTITLQNVSTPSAPVGNNLTVFGKKRAGRMTLNMIGPAGIDTALQPALFGNTVYMWLPGTSSTVSIGFGTTWTARNATGAQSHPTKATTNFLTQMNRALFSSTAAANTSSGIQSANTVAARGNAAGIGGFFFFSRFGVETLSGTGQQIVVGLSSTSAALAGEPSSTLANMLGIVKDSTDTNWYFASRTNTGTATKLDTEIPVTAGHVFDLLMFCKPNDSKITVRLVRQNDGLVVLDDVEITSTLPVNTTFLYAHAQLRSTGTAVNALALNRIYVECDI